MSDRADFQRQAKIMLRVVGGLFRVDWDRAMRHGKLHHHRPDFVDRILLGPRIHDGLRIRRNDDRAELTLGSVVLVSVDQNLLVDQLGAGPFELPHQIFVVADKS